MSAADLSRPLILVVDDEMHLRLFIKAVFESAGFRVGTAKNGKEGLAWIRANRPDLVSLDLMMPEQGGVRLLQQLRSDPDLTATKVMVVSAIDDATFAHAMSLVQAGNYENIASADGYVEKPPTAEAILREANRILGGKDARHQGDTQKHEENTHAQEDHGC
jgi:CheY-like chemotaxis protein